jgi:hypothetical protein
MGMSGFFRVFQSDARPPAAAMAAVVPFVFILPGGVTRLPPSEKALTFTPYPALQ